MKVLSNMQEKKWENVLKHLRLKLKFILKRKLGNEKIWVYRLEKKPYFTYGKKNQIGKVSTLLLILILSHGTAI